MRKAIVTAAVVAGLLGGVAFHASGAASPVSVTLPPPVEAFPGGPEADLARRHCLTCHSSDYVYSQPKLSKAQWSAEVIKMVKVYGASIPDAEVGPIVDYLVAQNGKP